MSLVKPQFTNEIINIIHKYYPDQADIIFSQSELINYFNIKSKSANRGSKSRASFGNHYAIYVLVEDYLNGDFHLNNNYSKYEGAQFSNLLRRQRELPFGSKLQNHALNHRLNEEFKKYFPNCDYLPIIRDVETNRYWLNENLIKLSINNEIINIARLIKEIIEAYIKVRQRAFNDFICYCEKLLEIQNQKPEEMINFIKSLLNPNSDARIFEIISFAILKPYYGQQNVYWGWSPDELNQEYLILYKTGRTNANDGGIDFVMKPLGRFFQVTETIDVSKYFLDIDKV